MITKQDVQTQFGLPAYDGSIIGQTTYQQVLGATVGSGTDPSIQSLIQLPDFPPDDPTVGNVRGYGAIDLQGCRGVPWQIAGNRYSLVLGFFNIVSFNNGLSYDGTGTQGIAIGHNNVSSGYTSPMCFGANNLASDIYACTLGVRNTASSYAALAAGYSNTASGYGAAALGVKNTASGQSSVTIGRINNAAGQTSYILGHNSTTGTDAQDSLAFGSAATSNAPLSTSFSRGVTSHEAAATFAHGQTAAWRNCEFAIAGVFDLATGFPAGVNIIGMGIDTTNNTPTELLCGGNNVGDVQYPSTHCILLPQDGTAGGNVTRSLHSFFVMISAFNEDGSDASMFMRQGMIKITGGLSGTAALVGSVTTLGTDNNAPGLSVAITADNTNKSLKITVTGANAKTYHWHATVYATMIARG